MTIEPAAGAATAKAQASAVTPRPDPSGRLRYVLRLAMPGDCGAVRGLVREASRWLRTAKGTDQWARPWPDASGHRERILNDIRRGKTWIAWDRGTAAATIIIDTEEPLDLHDRPIWPEHLRSESALYIRRVVVGRHYAGFGLGAALLDWAADTAGRNLGASVIRIDAWTTNRDLHAYLEGQRFTRGHGRDPRELAGYPSQALFERAVDGPGSDYGSLVTEDRRSGMA